MGIIPQGGSVIRALGENLIKDLTVTGAGEAAGAIKIEGDHVTVRDNKILFNLSAGVYISANVDQYPRRRKFVSRECDSQSKNPRAAIGSAITRSQVMTQLPAPRITSIRYLSNQGFQLGMAYSEAIYSYRIQYSDDGGQTWKFAQTQVSPGSF